MTSATIRPVSARGPVHPYDPYGAADHRVQCTSFQSEVRAVDAAGNRSPSVVRRYCGAVPHHAGGGGAAVQRRAEAHHRRHDRERASVAKFDFDGDGTNDVVDGRSRHAAW